ncbi:MAG: EAL domain-containing protein [Geminicoccaceae bacterium]|nr:MAG: EAL domain-containing protein [Geminicoccaceae bacterium]
MDQGTGDGQRTVDLGPSAWPGMVSRHVVDRRGRVVFRAIEQDTDGLAGLAASDARYRGRQFLQRVHPDDRPRLLAWLCITAGGARPKSGARLQVRYDHPTLGDRWLEAIAGTSPSDHREEALVFWSVLQHAPAHDIAQGTDIHQVQAQLQAAERAFGFGSYAADVATGEISQSPRYREMLGYGDDDPGLTSENWRSLIHPDDLPRVRRTFERPLGELAPVTELEYRMRHRSGAWVWVLDRLTGLDPDERGVPRRLVGIHVDITERKAKEARLVANEHRFRALFENLHHIAVQGYDRNRRVIYWNDASRELYGYSRHEAMGRRLEELIVPPAMRQAVVESVRAWIADGRPIPAGELVLQRKDGSPVPVFSSHVMQTNTQGEPELFCVDLDLSLLKAAQSRLSLTAQAFDSTAEGVVITDAKARIVSVNRAFTDITGYAEREVLGRLPAFLQRSEPRLGGRHGIGRIVAEAGWWAGDTRLRCKDGASTPVWLTVAAVADNEGTLDGYVGVFDDITDLERSLAKLDHLVHHDPITGLPNRLRLELRLTEAVARARRNQLPLTLAFLDIDRFKTINDGLGHDVGDALLAQVARRLQSLRDPTITLARVGGDDFVVMAEGLDRAAAGDFAARLCQLFQAPCQAGGRDLFVGVKIGISIFPDDGDDAPTLLRHAELAMYCAHGEAGQRVELFDAAMASDGERRLLLENGLRGALARGEFRLVYQPQVDLATNELAGVEALLRWHCAELGDVPPDAFIPIAEELGLIGEIGAWALATACGQMVAWERAGLWVPMLAVNVAPGDLQRSDFVATVLATLEQTGLAPHRLEIEVTETMIMRALPTVCANLDALRREGITVAVDDFGTGHSSLAYLNGLPLNRLKIDRSFIQRLGTAPDDFILPRAIIGLGRSLRLEVVAEGVETAAQAEFLRAEGCAVAQGYWFARPVPPEALAATLRARHLLLEPTQLTSATW